MEFPESFKINAHPLICNIPKFIPLGVDNCNIEDMIIREVLLRGTSQGQSNRFTLSILQ